MRRSPCIVLCDGQLMAGAIKNRRARLMCRQSRQRVFVFASAQIARAAIKRFAIAEAKEFLTCVPPPEHVWEIVKVQYPPPVKRKNQMDSERDSRLRKMVQEILDEEESNLDGWQLGFIEDMSQWQRPFSDKQASKIEEIWAKVVS